MYELFCKRCQAAYSSKSKEWKCKCGSPLNVRYAPAADLSKQVIRFGPPSVWRYREVLPVNRSDNIISLGEGFTPLLEAEIKGVPVLLKLEFVSVTGSFKDRGSAVMVSKLREIGVKAVVVDSAGNAGASIAAYCAKANIKCEVYIQATASKSKILQVQVYGAKLVKINGNREEVARVAIAAGEQHYFAGHGWNPYFLEGTKTIAFELWEQLDWHEPDAIVIPVGCGTLLLGAYYGFKYLLVTKKIRRLPRLYAVQSDVANPVYHTYIRSLEHPSDIARKGGKTSVTAEKFYVWQPARIKEIIDAVRNSDGTVLTVTDVEMSEALRDLGKRGIYVEPTAASSIAAVTKLARIGKISSNDVVVAPLTGSGLKATEKILRWVSID